MDHFWDHFADLPKFWSKSQNSGGVRLWAPHLFFLLTPLDDNKDEEDNKDDKYDKDKEEKDFFL